MSLVNFCERYVPNEANAVKCSSDKLQNLLFSSQHAVYKDVQKLLGQDRMMGCFSAAWAFVLAKHFLNEAVTFEVAEATTSAKSNVSHRIHHRSIEVAIPPENTSILEFLDSILQVLNRTSNEDTQTTDGSNSSAATCLLFSEEHDIGWERNLKSLELLIKPKIDERGNLTLDSYFLSAIPRHFINNLLSHLAEAVLPFLKAHSSHADHASEQGSNSTLSDITLASQHEAQIVNSFSTPQKSRSDIPMASLHQKFRLQASITPNKPALEDENHQTFSYRSVDLMSDVLAEQLLQKLAADGNRRYPSYVSFGEQTGVIALLFNRSVDLIISILATWKAGFGMCVLDPEQPQPRTQAMIEIAECSLVLTNIQAEIPYENVWRYDFTQLHTICLDRQAAVSSVESQNIDMKEFYHSLAWIGFTSGSTGLPKGVIHTHASWGDHLCAWNGNPEAKNLLFLNPSFAASHIPIYTSLFSGGCLTVVPKERLADLESCINEFGITELIATPSSLALVSPGQVPSLNSLGLCGEPMGQDTISPWLPFTKVMGIYGLTEVGAPPWKVLDPTTDRLPIYSKPLDDWSFEVYQPGIKNLCPLYVPGELCVTVTHGSLGYINGSEEANSNYLPNPRASVTGHPRLYRTGDLAMLTHDNKIALMGRIDNQIKIDGNRVEPKEIEEVLLKASKMKGAKIVYLKNSVGRKMLAGALIPDQPVGSLTTAMKDSLGAEATAICLENLPRYMCPSKWIFFDEFPKLSYGKTNVKEIERQVKEELDEDQLRNTGTPNGHATNGNANSDSTTLHGIEAIADVCGSILIGPSTNLQRDAILSQSFLRLGGTSLDAMKVIRELAKRGLKIGLKELLEAPNLKAAAMSMRNLESNGTESKPRINGHANGHPTYKLPENFSLKSTEIKDIYPTSMFQSQFYLMTILHPRTWCLYHCFDFSNFTKDEVRRGLQILVDSKDILRTYFVPIGSQIPKSAREAIGRYGLTAQHFVQVVRNELEVNLESIDGVTTGLEYYQYDIQLGWRIGELLWRVSWIEDKNYLALTYHNVLADQWSSMFLLDDFASIMQGIKEARNGGPTVSLEAAQKNACRPSMQSWVIDVFGHKGLDEKLYDKLQQYQEIWREYLQGCEGTYLDDGAAYIPPDPTIPPPEPYIVQVELPYRDFCTINGVTSGAVLQAAWALTLAHLVSYVSGEVSFYRLGNNRDSRHDAMDIEGALVSLSPIRVQLSSSSTLTDLVRTCMREHISLRAAEPYYSETFQPGGFLGCQRAYGNTMLNHIIIQPGDNERPSHSLTELSEEMKTMSEAPTLYMVTSMAVIEPDPIMGRELELGLNTDLPAEIAWKIVRKFAENLRVVIASGGKTTVGDMIGVKASPGT